MADGMSLHCNTENDKDTRLNHHTAGNYIVSYKMRIWDICILIPSGILAGMWLCGIISVMCMLLSQRVKFMVHYMISFEVTEHLSLI